MFTDDSDNILDDNQPIVNQDTARYLQHIEGKIYSDIVARKRIDAGLLFIACQVGSCSLSWFLFSLQLSTSVIAAISATIALLPGLVDAGESFNFELSSERWGIRHDKPLVAIAKLALGGVINWHGTSQIMRDNWATESAIRTTYSEIRSANRDSFVSVNYQDLVTIAGGLVAGICLLFIFARKFKNVS
jgi:hypothetical protein